MATFETAAPAPDAEPHGGEEEWDTEWSAMNAPPMPAVAPPTPVVAAKVASEQDGNFVNTVAPAGEAHFRDSYDEDDEEVSGANEEEHEVRFVAPSRESEGQPPLHQRQSIYGSFLDFLTGSGGKKEPREAYEVTIEDTKKVLITFDTDELNQVRVSSFSLAKSSTEDAGLVRIQELVQVHDLVASMNGRSVVGMDIDDFSEDFEARSRQGEPITLGLTPPAPEAGTDRTSTESAPPQVYSAEDPSDSEVALARKWIGRHKMRFYTPPPAAPSGSLILCYVERHRGQYVHAFHLMREDNNKFILACSCEANMKSGFVFSTLEHTHKMKSLKEIPAHEDSAAYIGCMTHNYLCTEFVIHDHHVSAEGLCMGRLPSQGTAGAQEEKSALERRPSLMDNIINAVRSRIPRAKEIVLGETDAVLGRDGFTHEAGAVAYDFNLSGSIPNFMKILLPRNPIYRQDHVEGPIFTSAPFEETKDEKGEGVAQGAGAEPEQAESGDGESGDAPTDGQAPPLGGEQSDWGEADDEDFMERREVRTLVQRWKASRQRRSSTIAERLQKVADDFGDLMPKPQPSPTSKALGFHQADEPQEDEQEWPEDELPPPDEYGTLEQKDVDDLLVLETKRPAWSEELKAWTLNFEGRVKRASKKNFLIAPEKGNVHSEHELGEGQVYLRFGKVTKKRFSLDFRAPMSPIVALGVACSTFSDKKVVQ
uniref:Tubby C-terminal domain-containing protein n=1 Tax=Phaeomonas parva TaxID=124430 RepID=A0A7S1TR98_9STRA|mmetsp:Transcript_13305/g.39572  ORF Transcript_13305/g.39572 Transcript_13305/m.39572 type:complete len:708 (+) Transcript_13305:80-2203(+)